jgi:uncharacterized protein (UPF0303 family)
MGTGDLTCDTITSGTIACSSLTTSENVGIAMTNPVYMCHIKSTYDGISTGLHIDTSDDTTPNKYALTIYPYAIAGGQVGIKFRTQNFTGGTHTPLTIGNYGAVTVAGA